MLSLPFKLPLSADIHGVFTRFNVYPFKYILSLITQLMTSEDVLLWHHIIVLKFAASLLIIGE